MPNKIKRGLLIVNQTVGRVKGKIREIYIFIIKIGSKIAIVKIMRVSGWIG
jgi:hypothetical protein